MYLQVGNVANVECLWYMNIPEDLHFSLAIKCYFPTLLTFLHAWDFLLRPPTILPLFTLSWWPWSLSHWVHWRKCLQFPRFHRHAFPHPSTLSVLLLLIMCHVDSYSGENVGMEFCILLFFNCCLLFHSDDHFHHVSNPPATSGLKRVFTTSPVNSTLV